MDTERNEGAGIDRKYKMIKYPKIETLFVRDKETFKVIPELNPRLEAFNNVRNIIITEKIDGTNAQIELWHNNLIGIGVNIYSRNNLLYHFLFDTKKLAEEKDIMSIKQTILKRVDLQGLKQWYYKNFCVDKEGKEREVSTLVHFFGEVYGKGINKGGIYSNEKQFRAFDIQIGEHFISFYRVKEICKELNLKIVPVIYEGGISNWLNYNYLKHKFGIENNFEKNSIIENFIQTKIINEGGSGGYLEGFVIKAEPLLLNEYGQKVCCKIKRKDFLGEK